MYDAIVIGSRCAGAPTAMLLARPAAGSWSSTGPPSRATSSPATPSSPPAWPACSAGACSTRSAPPACPFTATVRFDFGPVVLEGEPVPVDGISDAVCIRRTILDTLLTAEAADAGAEVRQGFTVQELLWEDGRVVGIRGRDATGATVEERAHIVIGADGARSFVARAVGAPTYNEVPATTVNVYSYFRGLDLDAIELYVRPGRFFVATPTNDGLAFVNQTVPAHEADRYRGRMADAFAETLAEVPHLADRLAAGRARRALPVGAARRRVLPHARPVPAGRWSATPATTSTRSPPRGCSTPSATPSCSPTPSTAASSGDLSGELLGYQRARDTAAMPMYELTASLANVEVPPPAEVQALIGMLAGNAHQTSRFLGLIAGSVPIPEFFSPESLAAIEAEAAQAAAA